MKLPKARTENIVVQRLKDEVLIYDLSNSQAFCLNDTAGKVFSACDGETTYEDLKAKYQFTDEIVHLTLDILKDQNLLESKYISSFTGISRREAVRKVGLASIIVLPVIASLTMPPAAAAASCRTNGQSCINNNGTQSNCCASTSRCFNGICVNCFGQGVVFVAAPTTGACANNPQRNLCCDTTTAPTGGNGPACVCP